MEETNNELQVESIVTGTIVKVDEKQVFVDIGQKSEGIIPISELSNLHVENPADIVEEGEELTLEVKKVEDEEIVLSKKLDRKSTRLNSSHVAISYAVFCLKKKNKEKRSIQSGTIKKNRRLG